MAELLDDSLKSLLGDGAGGDLIVVKSKKRKVKPPESKPVVEISKKKRKFLLKQQKTKDNLAGRAAVVAELKKTQLTTKQIGVMQPSSWLGQKLTHRQRLHIVNQHKAVGLETEVEVGASRPYQEELLPESGGVLTAGKVGGAQGGEENPEDRYKPQESHFFRGPLKKKDSDHYREGFHKPKDASHDTAGAAANSTEWMAGMTFGALAKARPLRRQDGGRDGLRFKEESEEEGSDEEEEEEGSESDGDPEAKMFGGAMGEDEEEGSDSDGDPEAKMFGGAMDEEEEVPAPAPKPAQQKPATQPAVVAKPIRAPVLKRTVVTVTRLDEIKKQREGLPIIGEEQIIMEAIDENDVVLIVGETGSGKTTQIPQFLYEAGYSSASSETSGMIGVTQPRRVAAMSTAKRVAVELNVKFGHEVAYQVRHDKNVGKKTRVKFMTDGILLKEIQSDFLLSKYSAIVIDEAHERSINTDVLIGLLSRVVALRREQHTMKTGTGTGPLKLIVMSATLRVNDFTHNTALFPVTPPIVHIPGRTHPVTIHFARRTEVDDYAKAATKKVAKIHSSLPHGGILVFMTGKREIDDMCHRLKKRFGVKDKPGEEPEPNEDQDDSGNEGSENEWDGEVGNGNDWDVETMDDDAESSEDEDGKTVLGGEDNQMPEDDLIGCDNADMKMHVLPLYSMLSAERQMDAWKPVPEGCRLVVVATNVAETSLTIPGIRYVVDSGRSKERVYDLKSGMSAFEVGWVSRANSDQRAGRAGRTGPGHCYRLFSSAVYQNEFEDHPRPEIERLPIDGMVLSMKSIGIDDVASFPFPSPPDSESLDSALHVLEAIGAVGPGPKHKISNMGTSLAAIPVSPRWGKMLLLGHQGDCLAHTVALVALLAVGSSTMLAEGHKFHGRRSDVSDLMEHLKLVGAYEYEGCSVEFCNKNYLQAKVMKEVSDMRMQLSKLVSDHLEERGLDASKWAQKPPNASQQALLQQVMVAGLVDQVARKIPASVVREMPELAGGYRSCSMDRPLWLHPSSAMFKQQPDIVCYQEVVLGAKRPTMRGVTKVPGDRLHELGATMCTFSAPMDTMPSWYDVDKDRLMCYVTPTYGKHGWQLQPAAVPLPVDDKGRYKLFAKLILSGDLVPELKPYVPLLRAKPATVEGKSAQLRTIAIVQSLTENTVDTLPKLYAKWKAEPRYLLEPYLLWVPTSHQKQVKQMWPPL